MCKVSIVVPVYNRESVLRTCLESLVGQTLKEIEIICIDDGSSDGSGVVLDEFAARDSRIRVIKKENGGAASAKNAGLAAVSGKYVVFVEPDDWCDLDMMRGLYETAERTGADVTICGFKTYDDQIGKFVSEKTYPHDIAGREQPFSAKSIADNAFIWFGQGLGDKFINSAYLSQLGVKFLDLPHAEDLCVVETCIACADKISVANFPYYNYRIRSKSSQNQNDKSPLAFCEGYVELRHQLEKRGLWDLFRSSFRQSVLASIVYALKSLSDDKALRRVYREVREKWVSRFGLNHLEKSELKVPEHLYDSLNIIRENSDPVRFMLHALRVDAESANKVGAELRSAKAQAFDIGDSAPLVSVIIAVRNGQDTIENCVRSVLGQTLRQIEVICVDDGSTDGTVSALNSLAIGDVRLRVIRQGKLGVSAARNAGLEAACGKYVAFLDADDEYVATHLWNLVAKAEAGMCDVVQAAHCEVVDGQVSRTSLPHEKCTATDLRSCPQIVRFQTKYIWDKLFRREMLERNNIRFAPYGYHEDHLFLFDVDLVARNFATVPEVGYRYSKSSVGAATRSYDERLLDCPKAYWDICRKAREAGLFDELADSIWANCSMSYAWRIWAFPKYDNPDLKSKIVNGWYEFFQATFPHWQKDMHLLGYPVALPPHDYRKVLLLGGTGALGAHLAEILAEQGCQVYVTSRSEHDDVPGICYLKGDAQDIGFFRKLTQSRWDAIVDFMVYGPIAFQQRLTKFLEMTDQYVFLSSSRVYADAHGQLITENSPRLLDTVTDDAYLKTSEYALAKARAENALRASGSTNWTIIRPYVTFSEQRLQLGTLEKEHWLKRVLEGKPIVFSDDVAARTTTLTYGRDVARGMASLIGRKEALGECFHITSSKSLVWRDVLEIYVRVIREVTGRACPVVMTRNSCQLNTPGKYQVLYDRLFDRRFDNTKIGRFIDVSTFRDPVEALESCLRAFLAAPKFLKVNELLESLHDKACGALPTVSGGYTVERNVQILIAALKAHGIRQVIASPGTTNLTFVASIQHDSFFTVKSAPDERSAAYMACGWAAESGAPVVISCTGATASRNYLPGLTEAYYRKLPILAVTGTLYEPRGGHLTPQFIVRTQAPTDTVRLQVSMPFVRDKNDEWANTVAANHAILELVRHGGGPVHINLETMHSRDYSVARLPPVRVIHRHFPGEGMPPIPDGRVAVFIGAHVPWSEALTLEVEKFSEKFDAPVFCDHGSNYRGKGEMNFTLACYQQSATYKEYLPDVLIHIGEVSADYPSLKIVGMSKVWRVSADGEIRDQFRRLVDVFEMDELSFFRFYNNDSESSRASGYRTACERKLASLRSRFPDVPFSNIWVASVSSPKVPEGAFLHLGILNSFRAWSLFQLPKTVLASCNAGGFGIDGCLSTLLGASFAHPDRIHFAVLGDLAFFYDLNSLGNRHVGANLRILLINNGKGMEFRNFNHPAYQFGKAADEFVAAGGHYGNKSRELVRHYAQDLGFDYLSAADKHEYMKVAESFWSPVKRSKPLILEVFTDEECENGALETVTLMEGAPPPPKPVAAPPPAKPASAPPPPKKPASAPPPTKPAPPAPKAAPAKAPAAKAVQPIKVERATVASRKIAILTFHCAYNCGAYLQGWALQTILRRIGFEPEFPDCTRVGYFPRFGDVWYKQKPSPEAGWFSRMLFRLKTEICALGHEDVKRHRFRMFAKHCLAIKVMKPKEIERRYPAVIVGSDQVWNPAITRKETEYFRTTIFKNPALKRYSYAISVGDAMPKKESISYLTAAAKLFENLSFRENLLPQLVDKHGRHPTVDLDPTLLLSKADFNRIAYPKRLERKPYLLVYSLMYNEKTWNAARTVAKRLGLKPVFILVYQYGHSQMVDPDGVQISVSPDRFLAYIRDAEVVITSSFHGTAFSLIYQKKFATLPFVHGKVSLRCQKLLKSVHEEIHQIDNPDDIEAITAALTYTPRPETMQALSRLSNMTIRKLRATLPNVDGVPRSPARPVYSTLTWPFHKMWGGIKCIKENGVGYTVKHAWGKVLRFAGVRSPL